MNILGLSAHHHDSAACLLVNGRLVAAAQEERFSRKKHDSAFPADSVAFCLEHAGLSLAEVDLVAFYENGSLQLERQLASARGDINLLASLNLNPSHARDETERRIGLGHKLVEIDHHESHAQAARFLSGFEECAVLVCDGVGEWHTTTMWKYTNGRLERLVSVDFPHSLGLLYATVTAYLGFGVNGDEYKVMGLAAYGQRQAVNPLRPLLRWAQDDTFEIDIDYFDFVRGKQMYSERFVELVGFPPRMPGGELLQQHKDLAASVQEVVEDAMVRLCRGLARRTGMTKVCISGGVAQNCASNRIIEQNAAFEEYFFQPASGDEGSAIGAAVAAYQRFDGSAPTCPPASLFLGPTCDETLTCELLTSLGVPFDKLPTQSQASSLAAKLLSEGAVVAWVCGPMEFGPRALGARSILADPRDPQAKGRINRLVKYREDFRPFAPAVLEERAADYFDNPVASRFMTRNVGVLQPSAIPATTHIDGTARLQTVPAGMGHPLREVLERFGEITGVPVLLNTSFNLRGEPMVLSPGDALRTFVHSGIDHLFIGTVFVSRSALPDSVLPRIRRPRFVESNTDARPAVYTFF